MSNNPYIELNVYELTHLIPHLTECDCTADVHSILNSGSENNDWFNIKISNNLFEGYIEDIKLAISISFREIKQDLQNDKTNNKIGTVFKYGLILSSISSSITINISPEVAAILVKRGVWSFERAITFFSIQETNQLIEFLKNIINGSEYENQEQVINKVIDFIPQIDDPVSRLSIILEISSDKDAEKIKKHKKQVVKELIESVLSNNNLYLLEKEKLSRIFIAIEYADAKTRKRVYESILQTVLQTELSDQTELLFELLEFVKSDEELNELINLYLSAVNKLEDAKSKFEGHTKILPKVEDGRKSEICQYAIDILRNVEHEKGATIPVYELVPYISSTDILIVAHLTVFIKKFTSQKAESISSIAERASSLNDYDVMNSLKKFINDEFSDPCCRAIAYSGFGNFLTQDESKQIIDSVLRYPDMIGFVESTEMHRIYETGVGYIINFLDEQSFADLLKSIQSRKITLVWWSLINRVVSLNKTEYSEKMFSFLSETLKAPKDIVLCLLELIEHLSLSSRKVALDMFFSNIPLLETEMDRTYYYKKAFLLSDKLKFEMPDLSGLNINDLDELVHSTMRILGFPEHKTFDVKLARKILSKINKAPITYSKAKALANLSYYLNQHTPTPNEKHEAVLKTIEIADKLSIYHKIKLFLRLLSSIPESQKESFFYSIVDQVYKFHETEEKTIASSELSSITHEAQIYTDMALIAAELKNYNVSLIIAEVITNQSERAFFLKYLRTIPQDYIRRLYKLATDSLNRGLSMSPPYGNSLIENSVHEICFLIPKLPSELIAETEKYLEKLDGFEQLDIINELIHSAPEESLKKFLSYARSFCNEYQLPNVLTNLISRYIRIGQIRTAKILLKEIENDSIYFTKNAIEILEVEENKSIEKVLKESFQALLDNTNIFLPTQKRIILEQKNISFELIKEYASILKFGYKYMWYYNDQKLNSYRIAAKLCNSSISEDERVNLIDECFEKMYTSQNWGSGILGEIVGVNSLNKPAFDEIEYERTKALEILLPSLKSIRGETRLRVLEKYFEYFLKQPRNSMLMEISTLYPIFHSIGDENLGNEIIEGILQVCSWWS